MRSESLSRTDPQQELLTRARRISQKAGLLHAECIEQTLPARALALLARDVAHDANWLLDRLVTTAIDGRPAEPFIEEELRRHP